VAPGREGLMRFIAEAHTAFPDLAVTPQDLIAEGDRVAVRWTASGTHLGTAAELDGAPATGRLFSIRGVDIFCIDDGKGAERWHVEDTFELRRQLGVLPAG
jgi:steroid delta-isomerase-like uncharacterized protein